MKINLVYMVYNTNQGFSYSYGLAYISAVLKQSGYQPVHTLIRHHYDWMEFISGLKKDKPDIIAFSITTSQVNYLKSLINEINSDKETAGSFIVCGGVHPTLDPESILEIDGVNCVIRGEGEYPLLELVQALDHKQDYFNIKNCWFHAADRVIRNETRPLIENLDVLPFPDIDALNLQREIINNGNSMRFIFSRGCPFECTYCSNKALSEISTNSKRYFRLRSPAKAIKEIEVASEKYKFSYIIFDDDCITLNKTWFYEFFALYREKIDIPFKCNIRVGTVDEAMMKVLKESGVSRILVGIEHGNEEFRKKILKRNMTNKQIVDTFRLCDKYDVICDDFFVMVGLPYENKELFFDTVRLSRQASGVAEISIFHPYPGTELGDICRKNNWMPDKQYYQERVEATISFPEFSKEQIQLCHDAFRYFILNKKIPLYIPLELVPSVYHLLESKKVIWNYVKKRIKFLFSWGGIIDVKNRMVRLLCKKTDKKKNEWKSIKL
ncbi:MAG TPA: radical SAM protein [Bacteroidales bacterium]|nr:radical SAM protein [Bacteroidales bacterium]